MKVHSLVKLKLRKLNCTFRVISFAEKNKKVDPGQHNQDVFQILVNVANSLTSSRYEAKISESVKLQTKQPKTLVHVKR